MQYNLSDAKYQQIKNSSQRIVGVGLGCTYRAGRRALNIFESRLATEVIMDEEHVVDDNTGQVVASDLQVPEKEKKRKRGREKEGEPPLVVIGQPLEKKVSQ